MKAVVIALRSSHCVNHVLVLSLNPKPRQKEEAERLAGKIREGQYESRMEECRTALFSCEQKVKALQREKDTLAAESGDRVTLRLKKEMVHDREAGINKL